MERKKKRENTNTDENNATKKQKMETEHSDHKSIDYTQLEKPQKIWPQWVLSAAEGKPLKLRKFSTIKPYQPKNFNVERGKIRVLRIYNRFANVNSELKKWPEVANFERYNVCKNNKYQDLSPMVLGPVFDDNGDLYAAVFTTSCTYHFMYIVARASRYPIFFPI